MLQGDCRGSSGGGGDCDIVMMMARDLSFLSLARTNDALKTCTALSQLPVAVWSRSYYMACIEYKTLSHTIALAIV